MKQDIGVERPKEKILFDAIIRTIEEYSDGVPFLSTLGALELAKITVIDEQVESIRGE